MNLPEGVHTVELAVPDAYASLRGKRVPASAWPGVAQAGLHMCSVIYSWSPRCDVRAEDEWLPPERGWPDMHVRPLLDTLRPVPWRPGSAPTRLSADGFYQPGSAARLCCIPAITRCSSQIRHPRHLLQYA